MSKVSNLEELGFSAGNSGAHLSRTMMLPELTELLHYLPDDNASREQYFSVITEENCLAKRSGRTRLLTARHLADLYTLDDNFLLFRGLKYFWARDEAARPFLALLLSYTRDAILRQSAPLILKAEPGIQVTRQSLEALIEETFPDRFSEATLRSAAQNINSTWTHAGYLKGRTKKIRIQPEPSAGAVAYALLLGYITGVRGEELFATDYIKLLDCSQVKAIELAEEASRKGWMVFKRVDRVIEVAFRTLINDQEMELLREQA